MDDLYSGEGSDSTGVPTKLVTVNCSLKINVHNPASTFGIHVTSSPINLKYLEIVIATGQVSLLHMLLHFQKYYNAKIGFVIEIKVPLFFFSTGKYMEEQID